MSGVILLKQDVCVLQFVAFALYVTPLLYMIEKVRSTPAHKVLFLLLPCMQHSLQSEVQAT